MIQMKQNRASGGSSARHPPHLVVSASGAATGSGEAVRDEQFLDGAGLVSAGLFFFGALQQHPGAVQVSFSSHFETGSTK